MMGARPPSEPVSVEDNSLMLSVTDEFLVERHFPCVHAKVFWDNIHLGIHPQVPSNGHSVRLAHIKQALESVFDFTNNNSRKWQHIWKVMKRLLTSNNQTDTHGTDDGASVFARDFIRAMQWFGCTKDTEDGKCLFLDQVINLLENGGARNGRKYLCWFAGHMTQDEAQRHLQDKENGTFLVRFSESRADCGGFAVGFKEGDEVKHFQFVGDPSSSCSEDEYDGKFHLIVDGNDEEETFPDLVEFVDERLRSGEGVSCTKICPNLPLNATFQGYD